MSNTLINKVEDNLVIISNNLKNTLAYQNLIVTFLKSDNYIQSLVNIFQLILDLTFLNLNANVVYYLSNIEQHLLVIDIWLNKSLFNLENISKGEVTIGTYIDLTFNNLTENINRLIHETKTKTNIISNQLLTFDNYIKAIAQFNTILKNHAITKEYITSVRVILSKSIVYIEKARFLWYNYNVCIQKAKVNISDNTNTITENTNTITENTNTNTITENTNTNTIIENTNTNTNTITENTNTNIITENKKRNLELLDLFESSKLVKKTTDFDTSLI